MNIYQPVLKHSNFLLNADTHFARDTHMRIILGNSNPGIGNRIGKNSPAESANTCNRYIRVLNIIKKHLRKPYLKYNKYKWSMKKILSDKY